LEPLDTNCRGSTVYLLFFHQLILNMRYLKISLFSLFALVLTVSACKKDEKTKTQLLTSKAWNLKALTINPGIVTNPITGTVVTDALTFLEVCDRDDLISFKDNFTILSDAGALKCDPSDPQTEPGGAWSFNSTETVLTVDGENWSIVSLTASELKITYSETIDGVAYTFTGTYQ
jgi:hypothetical protein